MSLHHQNPRGRPPKYSTKTGSFTDKEAVPAFTTSPRSPGRGA